MPTNNILSYTGLTYNEMRDSVISRLAQDSRFANYSQSQLYSVISEIFLAATDMTNFYIDRRANESFPSTAQLRSSIVELSKILGYVIRRPIPATTSINININSIPNGAAAGQVITFPKFSQFTFNGQSFLLLQPLQYILTQTDINNFANPSFFLTFNYWSSQPGYNYQLFSTELIPQQYQNTIQLVQASQKVFTINNSQTQADKRFQSYQIPDVTFSNYFGDQDFGFDVNSGNITLTSNMTRVACGSDPTVFTASASSDREFTIDRRSFLNDFTIPLQTSAGAGQDIQWCVLTTNLDDTVQLKFADDVIASIGATGNDNIYVQYLSTLGSAGNTVGVIGRSIQSQANSFGNGNTFTTSNMKFTLASNVVGGADIESIDSIKVNSPEIFYSLDRCVTPRDYVSYLKTLTIMGSQIENAITFGEQEITRDNTYKVPNIKMFNTVLFSVLPNLYSQLNGKYVGVKDDSNVLLVNSTSNDWFNLMVLSDSSTPLKDPAINSLITSNSDLATIYSNLYARSMITIKNIYVTPEIRDFQLAGNIYLNPLVDIPSTYSTITDALYNFFNNSTNFNSPVYLSDVIDVVQNFPQVNHANLSFQSNINPNQYYLYTTNSAAEMPSISAIFPNVPVGYVFNSSISSTGQCGVREYSVSGVDDIVSFYQKTIIQINSLSAYSQNTINAICCLLPKLELKMYKYDNTTVRTEVIWPSTNMLNDDSCGVTYSSNGNVNTSFEPSQRNLYLGLLQCFYNNIQLLLSQNPSLSNSNTAQSLIKIFDEFLANRGNCFCSLGQISQNQNSSTQGQTNLCTQSLTTVNLNELNSFVQNDLINVATWFKNSLEIPVTGNLLDGYGNIVNFSLTNEIPRITAPALNQYLYN